MVAPSHKKHHSGHGHIAMKTGFLFYGENDNENTHLLRKSTMAVVILPFALMTVILVTMIMIMMMTMTKPTFSEKAPWHS